MKILFILSCLFSFTQSFGQTYETYYDYQWKPCEPLVARFFSQLEKTDSGWFRHDYFLGTKKLQMENLYEDSACKINNGKSSFYYANGSLKSIGRMVHNKREGICLSFYSTGEMMDSANFHDGKAIGYRMGWHRNGYPADSTVYKNDSTQISVHWFDNGNPSAAGVYLHEKLHGKWQFFHKNGNLSATETYQNGVLVAKEYFTEAGEPLADTTSRDRKAEFKGGVKAWQKYLEKKLAWPTGYQFDKGNLAVVAVEFTVNEEGKVVDVEIKTPFHPAFDDIALRVIKNSPVWQPALSHNRVIKYSFNQAVTFQQPE